MVQPYVWVGACPETHARKYMPGNPYLETHAWKHVPVTPAALAAQALRRGADNLA
jgi:hypothetical protein